MSAKREAYPIPRFCAQRAKRSARAKSRARERQGDEGAVVAMCEESLLRGSLFCIHEADIDCLRTIYGGNNIYIQEKIIEALIRIFACSDFGEIDSLYLL